MAFGLNPRWLVNYAIVPEAKWDEDSYELQFVPCSSVLSSG